MGENDKRRAAGYNNTLSFNCTANSTVLELLSLIRAGLDASSPHQSIRISYLCLQQTKYSITNWAAGSSDSLKLGRRSEQEDIAF